MTRERISRSTRIVHDLVRYSLVNERISKCVPGAQEVSFPGLVHNAPSVDPAAFTTVLFELMSKRQGL
jgi:hypothetical protein